MRCGDFTGRRADRCHWSGTGAGACRATPTIAELAPELARGAIKAERLAEDALAAIAAQNPRLNAFITVTADQALAGCPGGG